MLDNVLSSQTKFSPIENPARIFRNVAGGEVSREQVLEMVSEKTFEVYRSKLRNAGLVTFHSDGSGHANRVDIVRLTQKGAQVLGRDTNIQPKEIKLPQETPATARVSEFRHDHLVLAQPSSQLDEITNLTDKFNASNRFWEWKLVRKGGS